MDMMENLRKEGVDPFLLREVEDVRKNSPVPEEVKKRVPDPEYLYYGPEVLNHALAALLAGKNLLLTGPKATGKNVLAENLGAIFSRPVWNISLHMNMDAASLIGMDTYDGERVSFRPGPIWQAASFGGFAILDEINMAKNEALAVLHSALDFRRVIDVPGYDKLEVRPECRFIATMNYGYAGTRELNEALTSRFAVLEMPMITPENLEKLILGRFPAMNRKICAQLIRLFEDIAQKAENAEISDRALDLRGLLDAISLMEKGLTSGEAIGMCVVNKVFDTSERQLVKDCVDSRIPADLTRSVVFHD